MRNKVAKRIRRNVYVAQSHRIKRQYETLPNGSIRNVGLRRVYQEAKKEYKARMSASGYSAGPARQSPPRKPS